MERLTRYVATLRAVYDAPDEVTAILIADKIRENGSLDLEEEDGDVLEITQVTNNPADLTPEETLNTLRKARNALIRTRIRQCYELARELDKTIYLLQHRSEGDLALAGYDYGTFIETTEIVLEGGDPDGR